MGRHEYWLIEEAVVEGKELRDREKLRKEIIIIETPIFHFLSLITDLPFSTFSRGGSVGRHK